MDAQRRDLGRAIKRLRVALEAGDVQWFAKELEKTGSADLLTAIREQKLLLKSHPVDRGAVAAALRATAEHFLHEPEASQYVAYLHFVEVWECASLTARKRLSLVLGRLPKMGISQLLGTCGRRSCRCEWRAPHHPERVEPQLGRGRGTTCSRSPARVSGTSDLRLTISRPCACGGSK